MLTFPRLFVALIAFILRAVSTFDKDTPKGRAKVVPLLRVSGLHHQNKWRDAA